MRPHRLVLEGFGPFRDRQTVDFDAVARDGIFLITGPTGAGKTTILDGLCFALFNTVPGPRGSAADLRSHLTAPGDGGGRAPAPLRPRGRGACGVGDAAGRAGPPLDHGHDRAAGAGGGERAGAG
jgi:hypothetical protein